jgi:hypothetical protein
MEYNPFATGAVQGFMAQQDKNRDKRLQDQDRAAADADKRRKELENQFNTDITSVREMLAQTTDPQRREAIMRSLQVMKSAYTGASARQAGLADLFGRQIDLLMKAPSPSEVVTSSAQTEAAGIKAKVDALVSQGFTREQALAAAGVPLREYTPSSTGTSGGGGGTAFERLSQKVQDGTATPQEVQWVETQSRGGMDAFTKETQKARGKIQGTTLGDLEASIPDIDATLAQLDLVENSISGVTGMQRGATVLGVPESVVAGATDLLGGDSSPYSILSQQSTKSALEYVNKTKGAVSDAEMAMFKSASLGPDKSPDFNKTMISIAKAIMARKSQEYAFKKAWFDAYGEDADTTKEANLAWKDYIEKNKILEINGSNARLLRPVEEIMADTSYMSMIDPSMPQDTPQLPAGTALPDAGTAGPVDLNAERILPIPKAGIKPLDYYKNKYGVE